MGSQKSIQNMPSLWGKSRATSIGSISPGSIPVFVNSETLDDILRFSETDLKREIGGFLLGNFHDGNYPFIQVSHFLPAAGTNSRSGSVTFTHDTWKHLNHQIESGFPNLQVIGWHHTHPSMGIFLSSYDRFIHDHFFAEPWQIAMVVDPCQQQFGLFQWLQHGAERDLVNNGFLVVPEKGNSRRPKQLYSLAGRS